MATDATHSYALWLIHLWHDPIHMRHDSYIFDITRWNAPRPMHMCHDSYIRDVTWLHHIWHAMSHVTHTWTQIECTNPTCDDWHGPLICAVTHSHVTWPIHVRHGSYIRDMTPSYYDMRLVMPRTHEYRSNLQIQHVWRPTWPIHMRHDSYTRDMTPSYMTCDESRHTHINTDLTHRSNIFDNRHDPFICAMTYTCAMTPSYVPWLVHTWHDSSIYDVRRITSHTHEYRSNVWQQTSIIRMCHDSYICDLTPSYTTCDES